ncbi:hypothetical protein [Rummeliibacillus suwonensis]
MESALIEAYEAGRKEANHSNRD